MRPEIPGNTMIRDATPSDPYEVFAAWLKEAEEKELNDHNAMCLASVDANGMPSARMVLLKDWDHEGFVFYTNFESRKGEQLLAHPKAALMFHWKSVRRSVRVEGMVEQVTSEEADAYFASRPKQSQIGAWASDQSRPLTGRFELEKKVAKFAAKYGLGTVPRPPHWSGFRVRPQRIEFWQDGPFRLHDRLVYHSVPGGTEQSWTTERLYP
ncbi:pyridoxamine 5'-phosphate oxidase [Kiloniella laminariae]|uniref:Pyridoxine/pyridoxamine 5'-phosphate oxidase n=1 Tax=Kiloniella laminariae TaxID=454162 RepID=A0ABT4LE30_9PROT|nr:pyridoxamine 5'-phosphate oxidase [Kiloniella laminariae]MCZ4279356.1 pyridoxamine 5'-phosphate oxidase [Kiloniella laminariae]